MVAKRKSRRTVAPFLLWCKAASMELLVNGLHEQK